MSHLTHRYLDALAQREELRQRVVKILDSVTLTYPTIIGLMGVTNFDVAARLIELPALGVWIGFDFHLGGLWRSEAGRFSCSIQPFQGRFPLVTEFSFLKERGVERVFFLSGEPVAAGDGLSLLYLCRPTPVAMQQIAGDHMIRYEGRDCHLYLVPRRTLLADRVLEARGVLGEFAAVGAFPMGAIPLEDDVYSLELTSAFAELYRAGDVSCLHTLATTLAAFREKHGDFSRVLGKGTHAKLLADMLHRLRMEKGGGTNPGALGALVILDRTSDLVTPLLTQLTYEGLLDERLKVQHGLIEMPAEAGRRQKVALNSSDPILALLRDLNFAEVPERLSIEARRISDEYNQRHAAQTVAHIRDFVSRLGVIQAEHVHLKHHTVLTEFLMAATGADDFAARLELEQDLVCGSISASSAPELVADKIDRQESLADLLRLVCLQCQVHGGLPAKLYAQYQGAICQAYGYHHLTTLCNLERAGLLYKQSEAGASSQRFSLLAKAFRLNVEEVNERQPNDISYVYSGYAPLSIRMVQCGVDASTTSSRLNAAALSSTLEGFLAAVNPWAVPRRQRGRWGRVTALAPTLGKPHEKLVVVVFLGGCTFTEIAALRYLSRSEPGARRYIVLTTGIISGESLLSTLVESGNPHLTR
ncbi:Vacuolar protein-sorting-associated protein 33 [Massospora cicadina]|nr:Vacuolar protein-sorting-associated protein 33 [Massospora cicadina]